MSDRDPSFNGKHPGLKSGEVNLKASLQPTLMPPQRSRVMSVDDCTGPIEQEKTGGVTSAFAPHHVPLASSESDGDENERTARPRTSATKSRRSTLVNQIKRTRSELSLESCPSDAEAAAPKLSSKRSKQAVHPTAPAVSRPLHIDGTRLPSVMESVTQVPPLSASLSNPPSIHVAVEKNPDEHSLPPNTVPELSTFLGHLSPRPAGVPVSVPSVSAPTHLQMSPDYRPVTLTAINSTAPDTTYQQSQTPAPPTNCQAPSVKPNSSTGNSSLQDPQSAALPAQSKVPSSLREKSPDDIEVVMVHIAKKPTTTTVRTPNDVPTAPANQCRAGDYSDPLLVNIAPLDISDCVGWDRFVFFAHHPRRFEFGSGIHVSELSPFAGITINMAGVQRSSICAVCGSSAALCECPRCGLGYHPVCVNRSRRRQSSTLCVACTSATINCGTSQWSLNTAPPPLPPPEKALPRLIADAQQGNPIDLILIPSLFNFYVSKVGNDWLRCFKCNQIRIIRGGAIAESVCIPFDCSQAFWDPEHLRNCNSSTLVMAVEERSKIEIHLKERSRLKAAMRYYLLGEEDRADFGFGAKKKRIHPSPASTGGQTLSMPGNRLRNGAIFDPFRTERRENVQTVGDGKANEKRKVCTNGFGNGVSHLDLRDVNASRLPAAAANGVGKSSTALHESERRLAVVRDGQQEIVNVSGGQRANLSAGSNVAAGLNRIDNMEHRQSTEDRTEIRVRLLRDIGAMNFDPAIEDALTELALADNEQLMNLYVALGQSPAHMKRFKRQAFLLVSRARPHPQLTRNGAGAHMPHGLMANRGLPGTMRNDTCGPSRISVVGIAQRRLQLGAAFKDFRLHQLRSELQLCSRAVNQLVETAPQNVAAVHSHTYTQIVAMREKQDHEIRKYLEGLAGLQVTQHRQPGTLPRQPAQAHPQRQTDAHQHALPHLQGVAAPQQEHLGLPKHFERRT